MVSSKEQFDLVGLSCWMLASVLLSIAHEALVLTVGQMWVVCELISVKRTKPKLTHEREKKAPSDADKSFSSFLFVFVVFP